MNKPTHREFELKLPMRLRTSTKKVTALNLNVYRNLHYRSLTALKHRFHEHGRRLLRKEGVPPLGRIQLEYAVFARTRREFDVANICTVVDKFFSDTLTEAGIIEDDNWKFLDKVTFGFGGFSKQEYVLVTITEIEPRKEEAMRILLDEDEIQAALEAHVFETLGISGATGVQLESDDDGNVTAEILLGEAKTVKTKATPRKNKGGRPAGSKNKPKEEPDDVSTTAEDGDDSGGTGDTGSAKEQAEETSSEEAKAPAKTAGGGNSKNLFEESPETSSTEVEGGSENDKESGDQSAVKPAKKSSIFDQ